MWIRLLPLVLSFPFCFPLWAIDGTGLKISASTDIVGGLNLKENSGATNSIQVRGAEVMLYAPADHLFDGTLSVAAHGEGGIPQLELHEAWVGSTRLLPRSRFRVGQFFLGVGRLNQFHQHDWPFITAPRVHQTFLAPEGALDTGLEYTFLFPTPFFLEFTLGVTNGYVFGHDHSRGNRPQFPTHYGRLQTFVSAPESGGTQLGLNYIGRMDSAREKMSLIGLDWTSKWKEAATTRFLLQSEVWYRVLTLDSTRKQWGSYLYPQLHAGDNVFVGLRLDYFSDLSLTDATNVTVKNFELAVVPTLTYKSSEFATFRLAYSMKPQYQIDQFTETGHLLEAQAIFILGAHPAHDF